VRLDLTPQWLDNLRDPHNPFVQWMLLIDLLLLLAHISIVYWVYRDALWRYNRGAPWGLLAAVFPIGGWLFYLMYRSSPLVELDKIEAELFDETEHEWTDFDTYKANSGASLFKELTGAIAREGSGYSDRVQLSRLKELTRRKTPEERRTLRELRREKRERDKQARVERRKANAERRRERKQQRRDHVTMAASHGKTYRLSDRSQRRLKNRLAVVEQLKMLPREDGVLEDLIFDMEYTKALEVAEGNLAVASEMNDPQGVVTYEAYIARLQDLLSR
jgi:hypothetical protein